MIDWFTYEAVAGTVRVVRMSQTEHLPLEGNEGISYPSRLLIVINEAIPYDRACRVAVHEIMHMDLSNPGESAILCLSLHCTSDVVGDREEDIVSHLAPRNADTLLRNRFLRFPRFKR